MRFCHTRLKVSPSYCWKIISTKSSTVLAIIPYTLDLRDAMKHKLSAFMSDDWEGWVASFTSHLRPIPAESRIPKLFLPMWEVAPSSCTQLVEPFNQLSQSPDFTANDLCFFAFLKTRVWGMNASTVDDLVETIFQQYGDSLKRVWQKLFKFDNQTLGRLGNTFSSVANTGARKAQKAGTLKRVVKYDKGAFDKAWKFLASNSSDGDDDHFIFFPDSISPLGKEAKYGHFWPAVFPGHSAAIFKP